ncbi:MAG: hypothetical protein ACPL28_12265, partial [bacterium]
MVSLLLFNVFLKDPYFNISLLRLDICYPFPKPEPYLWFPGGAWGDMGILDKKLKIGIGTSIYESYDFAVSGEFSTGSFFPLQFHFAPYINPYGSYFARFPSIF